MAVMRHKEAIHSGHFMISEFETEEPDSSLSDPKKVDRKYNIVDISLKQLFQRMSIAYRHKLTSPKWNHFKGLKLRWKDKIRLNNVIWRCWHMQFIKGKNRLICAFANPLEIDHDHNMMESGALLEGKYWKRKARTITSEYQRWRLYHRHQSQFENDNGENGQNSSSITDESNYCDDIDIDQSLIDSDLFVGDLFDNLENTNHSFAVPFPNPRDVYKSTTNADFIQPALIQLQPNLEEINIGDLEWLNPTTPPSSSPCPQYGPHHGYASSSRGVLKKESTSVTPHYPPESLRTYPPSGVDYSPYVQSTTSPAIPPTSNVNAQLANNQNYSALNPGTLDTPKDLIKRSNRQRLFYRDANPGLEDCSCRPIPYPHTRTRSWSTSHINFPPSGTPSEVGSELITLLKNKSIEKQHPPLQLQIPPPPPNAAPQPLEDFDVKSYERSTRYRISQKQSEQKHRGGTMKNGFDVLRSLIPSLNGNSNLKISKAALLNKGGEYLQKLKQERNHLESEIQALRSKIQSLNSDIAGFQNELPSVELTGPECSGQMNDIFNAHVKVCSQRNWKYWIFSLLMRPLLDSFETSVGAGTFEDLYRTSLSWLDQHCSMRFLRSSSLKSLTYLSTATDILNHPERLPQISIMEAVNLSNQKNELDNYYNNNIKKEF